MSCRRRRRRGDGGHGHRAEGAGPELAGPIAVVQALHLIGTNLRQQGRHRTRDAELLPQHLPARETLLPRLLRLPVPVVTVHCLRLVAPHRVEQVLKNAQGVDLGAGLAALRLAPCVAHVLRRELPDVKRSLALAHGWRRADTDALGAAHGRCGTDADAVRAAHGPRGADADALGGAHALCGANANAVRGAHGRCGTNADAVGGMHGRRGSDADAFGGMHGLHGADTNALGGMHG
mmetsp:Transcript_41663/g.120308  ORF Transcript_41663/g.120308 Transcript_41663/m.120308 type:complete len:235 (+) Transcript_41663:1077-1781(+)